MLRLPARGDHVARRFWFGGLVAYVALAIVLYGSLAANGAGLGSAFESIVGAGGGRWNWAVLALVVTGLVLTIFAAAYLDREIRELESEEIDIAWLERTGRAGLRYVFTPESERPRLAPGGNLPTAPTTIPEVMVETLVDDRVRRIHFMSDASRPSSEELRIIAERRTARWGGLARYISSLLLLLAVLGTFAGVKTALPGLIDALGKSETGANIVGAMQTPLQAVAAAFGGNALALIGAIAVGLMAQGIAFGRRNLLERLELISAEYIYGEEVSTTSDPVQAAVQMFTVSARDFKSAAGAMAGIESGLENLGDKFTSSFGELGERLAELADRNGDELFDRTAKNISALQGRIAELTESVSTNAQIYAGLAPTLQTRTEETRQALAEMEKTNAQLAAAMEMLGSASRDTRNLVTQAAGVLDRISSASDRIAESTTKSEGSVLILAQAVAMAEPRIAQMDGALSKIADAVSGNQQQLADMWAAFAERIEQRIGDSRPDSAEVRLPVRQAAAGETSEVRRPIAEVGRMTGDETVKLLRQINESLRAVPAQKSPSLVLLSAIPVTAVIGTLFLAHWLKWLP